MGFFSWKTQDEGKSISNEFSRFGAYKVYMIDNKGNVWIEENYEGYGTFGGKDFFELLAEMNGLESDRSLGIKLVYRGNPSGDHTEGVLYPNLFRWQKGNGTTEDWIKAYEASGPESCPNQGFFYPECERCGEPSWDSWRDYGACPECGYYGELDEEE